MTLAINKFPAGTKDRWKVIAEFCGRSAKETIAMAKQLAEKKQKDVEAKRQAAQEEEAKREAFRKEAKAKAQAEAKQQPKENGKAAAAEPDGWTQE